MVLRRLAPALSAALVLALAVLATGLSQTNAGTDTLQVPWGDVDCSDSTNPIDSLKELRFDAALSVAKANPDCPDMGATVRVNFVDVIWGDVDCSGAANPIDSLKLLRFDAGLSVAKIDPSCSDVGALVTVGPSGGLAIVFEGAVPAFIDGEPLSVEQNNGSTLADRDDGWLDYFTQLGISAGDFSAASSIPSSGSDLDITVIALTADFDWETALTQFAAAIEGAGGTAPYDLEHLTMGGLAVVHLTADGPPPVSVYYHASGDTIWIVDSADAELVERVFEALPAAASVAAPAAAPQSPSGVPGAGPLFANLLRQPLPPVCVAEPFGRQQLMYMVIDAGSHVPVPAFMTPSTIVAGQVSPIVATGGAAPIFQYKANLYINPENILFQVFVPGGGQGIGTALFNVQHCLNGRWMDGAREIEITHSGSSVIAALISGEICEESGGNDFTGTLSGEQLSGSDLKVCNPDECVEAGFLENAIYIPYTATVASDGMSADFQWQNQFYDIVYDDNDNVVACNETYTQQESFSITRLTFGPGIP